MAPIARAPTHLLLALAPLAIALANPLACVGGASPTGPTYVEGKEPGGGGEEPGDQRTGAGDDRTGARRERQRADGGRWVRASGGELGRQFRGGGLGRILVRDGNRIVERFVRPVPPCATLYSCTLTPPGTGSTTVTPAQESDGSCVFGTFNVSLECGGSVVSLTDGSLIGVWVESPNGSFTAPTTGEVIRCTPQ